MPLLLASTGTGPATQACDLIGESNQQLFARQDDAQPTEPHWSGLDQIDLKAKCITRNKEGHYIMTKRTNYEEDEIIVNLYIFDNIVSSIYKEKVMFKEEI